MTGAILIFALVVGFLIYRQHRKANRPLPGIVVKTVKGDHAAENLIAYYTTRGYELQSQGSHKVIRQRHSLTFVKKSEE